jgi:hypothetical protein
LMPALDAKLLFSLINTFVKVADHIRPLIGLCILVARRSRSTPHTVQPSWIAMIATRDRIVDVGLSPLYQ